MLPLVVIFALFGILASVSPNRRPATRLLIENASTEAWTVDVVWRSSSGRISGGLGRVVEPAGTLHHRLRTETVACVRWIDVRSASVEAANPVVTGIEPGTVSLSGPSTQSVDPQRSCDSDLVAHPIRPRLGRWMLPGAPEEVYRERMIPRGLPR